MAREEEQKIGQAQTATILRKTYDVFDKNSIIPPEMKDATFKTFTVSNEIDEKAKNYALRLVHHYLQDGRGNALIMGEAGRGKTHLALAIAEKLTQISKRIKFLKASCLSMYPRFFKRYKGVLIRKGQCQLMTGLIY